MRRWRPKFGPGLWVGLVLLMGGLTGAALLSMRLALIFIQPPEFWQIDPIIYLQFVSLVLLLLMSGAVAYRVAGALTLSYEMDRNGFYIVWIGNRAVIPLAQIEGVDSGAPGAKVRWPLIRRIGYHWGRGRMPNGRLLHLFSSVSLSRSLLVHTATESFAISPAEQDSFVQELEQRRRLGAVKPLDPVFEPGRIFFYAFWNDQAVRTALTLALGFNLILFGILAIQYPYLSDMINLRFDAAGAVAEQRPRHQALFLPMAALMISLLNMGLGVSFYRRNKTGAQLLQFGSVLVQLLFGVALLAVLL
jgi:hypothetical protein